MAPINVGIIGYGLSAKRFHIPYIRASPHVSLYGIVERSGTTCLALSPPPVHFASVGALLADPAVALVVVASVNTAHYAHARAALEAGKDVIVDKPLAPTTREAMELVGIARRCGRKIAVYNNRRFDGDFMKLQQLLDGGLGRRPLSVVSHFDRYTPQVAGEAPNWRAVPAPGAGVLMDLGPHLVDQVVALFGAPLRIGAVVGSQARGVMLGPGVDAAGFVDDFFRVDMYYPDGLVATVSAGTLSRVSKQLRWRVLCEKGSCVKYGLDPQEAQLAAGMQVGSDMFGVEDPADAAMVVGEDGVERREPALKGDYGKFYEAFVAGDPKRSRWFEHNKCDAVVVLMILEMAKSAAMAGRVLFTSEPEADGSTWVPPFDVAEFQEHMRSIQPTIEFESPFSTTPKKPS
ncbi:hypothetical protein EDC01DRAFT_777862 [Geopyxis carbonaria]|nr:hypothetical protein EDC01DRAFT_777862 [Geopyxis carbonaria]